MIKKVLILVLSAMITLNSSCVETAMLAVMAVDPKGRPDNGIKPTLIELDNPEASQKLVRLRWDDEGIPSMDMSTTNSGEGWATGMRLARNEHKFFQLKYYALTLNFKNKTFVETSFDGAPLPEVRGSWKELK